MKRTDFTVVGQEVICIDSPAKHAFSFTPSIPLFVECESEAEFNMAFGKALHRRSRADASGQLRLQQEIWMDHRPLRSVVAAQFEMNRARKSIQKITGYFLKCTGANLPDATNII